jgi:hypothetical protein
MSTVTIQQMADRVAALIEQKLRVGGKGLSVKVRRAGRRLPKQVRIAAQALVQASDMAQSARLIQQVDPALVAEAYDICVRYLGGVDLADRRKGVIVGVAASIAFSLLAVVVLVVVVVRWRGLI